MCELFSVRQTPADLLVMNEEFMMRMIKMISSLSRMKIKMRVPPSGIVRVRRERVR